MATAPWTLCALATSPVSSGHLCPSFCRDPEGGLASLPLFSPGILCVNLAANGTIFFHHISCYSYLPFIVDVAAILFGVLMQISLIK